MPTKKYPPMRPDTTIFRSHRASPPEPSWGLLEVDGQAVRDARGDARQIDIAEELSNPLFTYGQEEIARLEHGGSWVNMNYILRLSDVLGVDWHTLVVNAPEEAPRGTIPVHIHSSTEFAS